ncbi:MAG: transglycosylase family protein [Acidimicrobiales bacterium]
MGSDHHQHQRRRFFYGILGAIFLASLTTALFPLAEAEQTVEAGPGDPSGLSLAPPPTELATTTMVSVSAPPSTAAPTTTTTKPKPKPTTTTTKPKPATTTTRLPAKAPASVAPAPPQLSTAPGMTPQESSFLACVRRRESGGNYSIVSANGLYYGAYQFLRSTWDSTARLAGRGDLVGVAPNQASPADQDALALFLYRRSGPAPWGGAC